MKGRGEWWRGKSGGKGGEKGCIRRFRCPEKWIRITFPIGDKLYRDHTRANSAPCTIGLLSHNYKICGPNCTKYEIWLCTAILTSVVALCATCLLQMITQN